MRGTPDKVNAHALLLGEAQLGVVPVRVDARARIQGADDVGKTCRLKRRERCALGCADVGQALLEEEVNVPDVVVLRGDVPVAHEGDLGVGVLGEPACGLVLELVEPLQLVRHVLVIQGAAVGNIQAPDADTVAGCGDGAGLLDGVLAALAEGRLVHEGAFHILQTHAGGNGHAVPLAEAKVGHLVAVVFKELPGEVLVLALGFLDGQHIRVGAAQPLLHTVGTGTQRVHIPGSNLHVSKLSS